MTKEQIVNIAAWLAVLEPGKEPVALLASKLEYPVKRLRAHVETGKIPKYIAMAISAMQIPTDVPITKIQRDQTFNIEPNDHEYRIRAAFVSGQKSDTEWNLPPVDREVVLDPSQISWLVAKVEDARDEIDLESAVFLATSAIPLAIEVNRLQNRVLRLSEYVPGKKRRRNRSKI